MTIMKRQVFRSVPSVVALPRPFEQIQGIIAAPLEQLRLSPVAEPDQDGPVELVLGAVRLGAAGVDEGVDSSQEEALLVELLQLARQFPHRGEAERRRPTWQTANREETSDSGSTVYYSEILKERQRPQVVTL